EFQYGGRGPHSSAHAPILSGAFIANDNLHGSIASNSVASIVPDFQLTFSDNTPGATFTVLAATNLSLPLNSWMVLGQPLPVGPGRFQFTDLEATNYLERFYRLSSP